MISIEGLDKARVLQALHGASRSQGLSVIHDKGAIDIRRAEELTIDGAVSDFDYVDGRVIKCDIGGDAFDPWLFDRDNGEGAAKRAIDKLRETLGSGE